MGGVAVTAVVFLAWVGWVAWVHGTPAAESQLIGCTTPDQQRPR